MTDDRAKTPRTLMIADHLWEAFSTMAVEMGSDRDALINQALYTFARLNGFLVPADLKRLSGIIPPQLPKELESSRPRPAPQLVSVPHGNPESVAKIAQQLAGGARPASNPPPLPPQTGAPVKPEPSLVEVDDSLLGEEGQATSMELPNIAASLGGIQVPPRPAAPMIAHQRAAEEGTITPGGRTLVLLADGRELDKVVKDRFLIGRGKHCDLIINSGKVSREHAAITREGNAWFIEDLGSSNGTWFDKRRISRRQIQEGDEYFICSEKIACSFR